jgi:hypothetical protein
MDTLPAKWTPTHCFHVPGRTNIIDLATADNRGMYSGETLEQLQKEYPGTQLMDIDAADAMVEKAKHEKYVYGPIEITEERFTEMLEILPPVGWKRSAGSQSFKMSERMTGNLTAIFCEIGGRYFELCDDTRNSHEWIVRQCQQVIDSGKAAQ